PLVVDGVMYIHTSFPNNTFALGLDDPGKILWQDKPKQNPAARRSSARRDANSVRRNPVTAGGLR
ncbi:hypothetical protein OMR07_28460, partial [Methylobacterium organophilum]|nr:hypothetical protein [Methylobacterium organophilum]